jgi:hypothetical protein
LNSFHLPLHTVHLLSGYTRRTLPVDSVRTTISPSLTTSAPPRTFEGTVGY